MMLADARLIAPAAREPLPQLPKKVPRYEPCAGCCCSDQDRSSSRLPLRWPSSGLWIDVPPALSGSAISSTYVALLLGLRQYPRRGLTGAAEVFLPPWTDPLVGGFSSVWPKASLSPNHTGRLSGEAGALHGGGSRSEFGIQVSYPAR